jgi:NAD(P)-dependent dehydrogenase (short-subunit alcohol dehydrogenase family)
MGFSGVSAANPDPSGVPWQNTARMSNTAPPAPASALDLFSLKGRRALITGGHMGLGITMARALAQAGADVALASRTLDACQRAAADLSAATGCTAKAFKVDVASAASVAELASDVGRDFGPVDILVNNAGINRRGAIEDLTEDDFDAVMDTNVKGVFLACRAFMPRMRERGWGRVVNLASILGTVGMAQRVPYASSKAAVANMTRVLGLEFATTGVTCNAIAPGPFATEMNRSLLDDPVKYKAFVEKIPMGRWGELHELAGAVVFLASDASSFVTGSILHVDGGWTAQ